MRRLHVLLPALAIALFAQSALAWNDTGHKTVALIAWDELKPEVRAKITALLVKHPQYATLIQTKGENKDEDATLDFITAATWPDVIRSMKPENRQYQHSNWHYSDIPFIAPDFPAGPKPEALSSDYKPETEPDNLLPALQKSIADLKDPKSTDAQKAIALAWIEHLIGDVHQPLHAVSWYSKEFPTGDRGGNSVIINGPDGVGNLHAYWDGLLGKYESLQITRHLADTIEKEHPRASFEKELKVTSPKEWAKESFELAKTVVYMNGKIPHSTKDAHAADKMAAIPPLPKEYNDAAKALAHKQIALAGYRLADELNALFADPPAKAGN